MDVVFNATANVDTDIPHALDPSDPESVRWVVVRVQLSAAPATPPVVYVDTSATRRPWQVGQIYLRCTLASVTARLLLFLE